MSRKNTSEMAVLGLLALGARTGYDIRQECEEKLGHFWYESYGQIYPVLHRLTNRRLVSKQASTEGGPRKFYYSLTGKGRTALLDWLAAPADRMRPRNELLLKTFLGRISGAASLKKVIKEFRDESLARRAALDGIRAAIEAEASHHPDKPFWLLTLDFGLKSLDAQYNWAVEAQHVLDSLETTPK